MNLCSGDDSKRKLTSSDLLSSNLISGDNGTIDGQGDLWWQKFHKNQLQYTRPYLIEIMYSSNIQISNLTLVNSPSWNVHPVYSRSVFDISVFFFFRTKREKNSIFFTPSLRQFQVFLI